MSRPLRRSLAGLTILAGVAVVFAATQWHPQFADPGRHRAGHGAGIERMMERGEKGEPGGKEEGNAWDAFQWWYGTRAFPNELIPAAGYYNAWKYSRENLQAPASSLTDPSTNWQSIGPNNIGGRMLSLALDPVNPSILWCGAASGGLWKSTTAGEGAAAWTRVDTGFPSLSVSSIVIDPHNNQTMYIGTGEMSLYSRPMVGTPGARSTYGLGILKSTDGGHTWDTTGLTWTFDQRRAVMAIRMDPTDSQTLFAATSEGLYKTADGGVTWTNVHPSLMAMDVVIQPSDHNRIYVAHGQLNSTPDPGLYRSTDGGATWTLLAGGLPTSNFGRTALAISADTNPTIYAGVGDASSSGIIGLYRSTDGGNTWTRMSSTNWAGGQSWYDNIVGLSPTDNQRLICAGLDVYRTTNGGSNLTQVSDWTAGYMGVIPPGGSEGGSDYVHADDHAVLFDPTNTQTIYIACDGGVFKSLDGGTTWAGKNGGLRTTQFYNGFANGASTVGLALGGLQDNGTVKYLGTDAWSKVFGGDGGWCAIDHTNENVLYEEYVYLDMYKSYDGGTNWTEIHPYSSSTANFIAPFVLSYANTSVLYAGMLSVQKSTNGGTSWSYPDGNSNWNGTPVCTIGISHTSTDTLCAATGSGSSTATFELRRTVNGGTSWTNVTSGLPNRYLTDISYDPNDSRIVWITFSGYGSPHLFRSGDAGLTWQDRTGDLPDIPAQSVVVDPGAHDVIFVGTDLGVYRSVDGGVNWYAFQIGMPDAMVLDLKIKPEERIMRAVTFGNGVYEVSLPGVAATSVAGTAPAARTALSAGPNPFRDRTELSFNAPAGGRVSLSVYDARGRLVRSLSASGGPASNGHATWDGRDDAGRAVAAGVYFARLDAPGGHSTVALTLLK